MSKHFTFAEAVALAGGPSRLGVAVDRVLGVLLLAGTGGGSALLANLFDAKSEALSVGQQVAVGLRDRLRGYGRYDRTHRLHAAHTVIVVTAFFAALDDIGTELRPAHLEDADVARLALGEPVDGLDRVAALLHAQVPTPAVDRTVDQLTADVLRWYASLADGLGRFAGGLAVADTMSAATWTRIRRDLPGLAVQRYQELYRRLAVEVREFAVWSGERHAESTGMALGRLERLLTGLTAGHTPDERRAALSRAWRAALERPILSEGDAPSALIVPALSDAYVDPRFRLRMVETDSAPAEESWWHDVEVRGGLAEFFARFLTSPAAVHAPLLVLGQPGAGKSVLTKILAARLPAADFLPVRVALREVPADADPQTQIELAVRAATGDAVAWPDLVRGADGALPVVLLDGFDELLQATGLNQSDYLSRVAAFQQRELDQGRPVVIVVTTRIAVADRARMPARTMCLRLEPFDADQVRRWLEVWNSVNARAFADRGLRPLPAEIVLRQPDLASEPLLLLMLALYDGDANQLQRDGVLLDRTALYERLLTAFAVREIAKAGLPAGDGALRLLVEDQLVELSVAAFAMFNRRRQWVTAAELDADLAALLPARRPAVAADHGFRTPLDQGEQLVGRFFFIQQAQATFDDRRLATYEFLHATFGEYLMARLILVLLTSLAAEEEAAARSPFGASGCRDHRLYALLSFAALTDREPVCAFLTELTEQREATPAWPAVAALPVTLFRRLDDRGGDDDIGGYRPAPLSPARRSAIYGLNLVLITVALRRELLVGTLYPDGGDFILAWRQTASAWQGALPHTSWWGLCLSLATTATWTGTRGDLLLRLAPGEAEPPDPFWMYRMHPGHPDRDLLSWQHTRWDGQGRQSAVIRDRVYEISVHAVQPLLDVLGPATTTFVCHSRDEAESIAHAVMNLLFKTGPEASDEAVTALAGRAVHAVVDAWAPTESREYRDRSIRIVRERLQIIGHRIAAPELEQLLDKLR
jgi:hypothetical protein